LLPFELSVLSRKTGQEINQLREFDLQSALVCPSVLRKDVEDQLGAIENRNIKRLLEVALLRRAEFIVKNDEIRLEGLYLFGKVGGFTRSDVGRHISRAARLLKFADHDSARSPDQLLQLFKLDCSIVVTSGE
jgi:hypothetical protein